MVGNELIKTTSGQVCFGVRQKPLTFKQKAVMSLVNSCVSNLTILDEYVLQEWFLEKIVKPRNRIVDGKYLGYQKENGYNAYERILEYDLYKRKISEHNGLLPWWDLSEAKSTLKLCIGALVVKGYLTVIPNIKISETPELENK